MGDENFAPVAGGFVCMADDDGEWQNLGYVSEGGISFVSDSDEDEQEAWADKLLDMGKTVSFRLKLPWYMQNTWYWIFTGHHKWTVPKLRKGKKGH